MDFKSEIIRFSKPFSMTVGCFGGLITMALAVSDASLTILGVTSVVLAAALAYLVYCYIDKAKSFRDITAKASSTKKIFEKTHTSWHIYKRLIDSMHIGDDDPGEFAKTIQHALATLINNFRQSMNCLYPGADLRVSLKSIEYKNVEAFEEEHAKGYVNEPFFLNDIPLYRDTAGGPRTSDDIIDGLDFDSVKNSAEMVTLKETLFYECFCKKKIVHVDKFNEAQKKYTRIYNSGLVGPIIHHGIPFAFVCLGSEKEGVFSMEDYSIMYTFIDAIAEYIRIDLVFTAIQKSEKIIVTENIAGILEQIHVGNQDEQTKENL